MLSRRRFLQNVLAGAGGLALASLPACRKQAPQGLAALAAQQVFDPELKIYYPAGCGLRVVARSGAVVANTGYTWHGAPDGGACFSLRELGVKEAGWIYVSNSELPDLPDSGRHDLHAGGASALRFDGEGQVSAAYAILDGTRRNCAGGATPWQTWLSCEEVPDGLVYECDPLGRQAAVPRPALGRFFHEAAAWDPYSGSIYLTEDANDGCLYRFKPRLSGDLSAGILEVAVAGKSEGMLEWRLLPDPSAHQLPCRQQVPEALHFRGAEGIVAAAGTVTFATKRDNRVWRYDVRTGQLRVIYDVKDALLPVLKGVDNLAIAPGGDVLVAEDEGNMQIVVLDKQNQVYPLLTIEGQELSEVCGPAFSPDGRRLYFSSQRGASGLSNGGITYELTFPFAV